jgi:hypothetical protein
MMRSQQWEPSVDVDADLVEYVIVGVPELSALEAVATALAALVRSHAIRILDVVTLVKASDGSVEVREVDDVDALAVLGQVPGYFGGLLSSHDLALASDAIAPNTAGILLLAEDRWAGPLSVAAREAGGRVLGGERVLRGRIHPALADAVGFIDQSGREAGEEEDHATHREVT